MKSTKKGFSLIELIVVMAIVGILVLLAVPRYLDYTDEAKINRIKADIKTVDSKAAEYMSVNNDQPPANSTEITVDQLTDSILAAKLYSTTGLIDDVDVTKQYYVLDDSFVESQTGSKLNGDFVVSSGGDTYYISDKPGTGALIVTAPEITLTKTEDNNTMLASVNYSKDATGLEYKIGNNEWLSADITSAKNNDVNLFAMQVYAADVYNTFTLTIPYYSVLSVRAIYPKGKTTEASTSVFMNSDIKPATTEKVSSLAVDINYTSEAHTKEYRIDNNEWIEYTGPLTLFENAIIQSRGLNKDGHIIEYNSLDVVTIEYQYPEAVISMDTTGTTTTMSNINWGYSESLAYGGTTIINAEWQNKQSVYSTAGTYTIRLRVQDSNRIWSPWVEKTITVEQYLPPVAIIGMTPDTGINTMTNVTFGYTDSIAYQGNTIINAEWDGALSVYSTSGTYTVRLRVQDSNHIWSSWVEKTFIVTNVKPTAVITMSPTTDLLQTTPITWSYANSTDPSKLSISAAEWQLDANAVTSNPNGAISAIGNHTMKLRVQNSNRIWSDWVSKSFVILTEFKMLPGNITQLGTVDRSISYLFDEKMTDYMLFNSNYGTSGIEFTLTQNATLYGYSASGSDNGGYNYRGGLLVYKWNTITSAYDYLGKTPDPAGAGMWYKVYDFTSAGKYKMLASAPNYQGFVEWEFRVKSSQANNPPVASLAITPATNITEFTLVSFSSTSTDPDGDLIATCEWQLDSNPVTITPPNNIPFTVGTHTIKLRVRDTKYTWSNWTSVSFTVTAAPTISPTGVVNLGNYDFGPISNLFNGVTTDRVLFNANYGTSGIEFSISKPAVLHALSGYGSDSGGTYYRGGMQVYKWNTTTSVYDYLGLTADSPGPSAWYTAFNFTSAGKYKLLAARPNYQGFCEWKFVP